MKRCKNCGSAQSQTTRMIRGNDMGVWRTIEKKYKEADLALTRNDPRRAERLLRQLVKSAPDEPLFHWRLGSALSEMKKYQPAVREFRQALQLDPRNVAALGCLGRVYMELGKWSLAEKAIRARLALKESPQHYIFLANILLTKNQYHAAAEYCKKAIQLDPSFEEAFLNLGLIYRHQNKIKDATAALERAVEIDSAYSVAFRELGLTYYLAAKFDLARKALETCLDLQPDDAWGHVYLALCLQPLGDVQSAATHFQAALKSDPKNPFFRKKQQEFMRRVSGSLSGNGFLTRRRLRNKQRSC